MKTHNLDSSMKKRSLKNLLVSECMFPFKTKTTTISKTKSTKKILKNSSKPYGIRLELL